jgi:8-oxo-dGTP pyrophosphatase MutT (NUDIX family)
VRASPPVVVYVTREDPQTAVDQLLVFDILGDRGVDAVVPGGGIEPGETAEVAARRETVEEAGIEVEVVRELAEEGGSHFMQAEPVGPTRDEWEHLKTPGEQLVRCRWVEVRPDLQLWGERGAFVDALIRRRVIAYVTRERDRRTELLTIEAEKYPEEGIQVPAGRLDFGETLKDGLQRELAEETGLTRARVVRELPDFESTYSNFCDNHAFHLVTEEETPNAWSHEVHGKGADAGLVYLCRWLPLTPDLDLWNEGDPMLRKLSKTGPLRPS